MSEDIFHELEIPDGVHDAEQAIEVFRAWIADGSLHVTFNPESFGAEIGEWGRLMADCLHHLAQAIAMNGQAGKDEALLTIREAFEHGLAEAMGEPAERRLGKISIKRTTQH